MLPRTTIEIEGKKYLTRYYLTGAGGGRWWQKATVFLHRFHASDTERDLHNHPWEGKSLILWGGYVETRCEDEGTSSLPHCYTREEKHLYVPFWLYPLACAVVTSMPVHCINELTLHDFHRVELTNEEQGCWTLFLAGERTKAWGFLDRATKVFRAHKMNEGDE